MTTGTEDGQSTARTAVATAERLARVETRVESLKEDTATIRTTIHSINGEMQKFVFAEQRCVESLARIADQTLHLPEILAVITGFMEIRPKLVGLITKDENRVGAWGLVLVSAAAVVGSVTVIGGLVSLVFTLLHWTK